MKLIVGLGNPGRRYASTPHNVGYEVVDELAARGGLRWSGSRVVDGKVCAGRISGVPCLLLKPTTYMNASGEAVESLVRGEAIEIARDLLVVLDDVALALGRLRLRTSGSSGGHRGLESVIVRLGSQQFARLRCGVRPDQAVNGEDLVDYVLAPWPKSLRGAVGDMVLRASDAAEKWTAGDVQAVMTQYNREGPCPGSSADTD